MVQKEGEGTLREEGKKHISFSSSLLCNSGKSRNLSELSFLHLKQVIVSPISLCWLRIKSANNIGNNIFKLLLRDLPFAVISPQKDTWASFENPTLKTY